MTKTTTTMTRLIWLLLSIIFLITFLFGIVMAVFELSPVLPAVICTVVGVVGMFISSTIWLSMPRCITQGRVSHRKPEHSFVTIKISSGTLNEKKQQLFDEAYPLFTPHATEALMKSIRGIPFLIQAIQYSLETSYYSDVMSGMGQKVIGTSVIHTAPGCASVFDCDSDEEHHHFPAPATPSPRLSGPEEQWEATESNRWSNQQLRLSMNRRTSSLLVSVFPYSESRPVDDAGVVDGTAKCCGHRDSTLASEKGSINGSTSEWTPMGSQQSQLSRVTVSHTMLPSREIRCIGMSSAFMNRFNSSFKPRAADV